MVKQKNGEPWAQRLAGRAIERPRDQPPHGLPVALRTAQHSTISQGRFEPSWSKRMVLAKWVLKGEAAMGIGGRRAHFGPGQVAVYLPSITHQFWALDTVNELCWFSMDGPLAEQFVLDLELQSGVYPCGPAPLERIERMMDSLIDHTIQGRRHSSLLAIEAWYELANAIRTPEIPSEVRRAQHMIQQEFADPDLSTQSLATKLHYHRGSLSRLFHKATGVTIIDYITQVRLQEAKGLLLHSPDKISEISIKCGFREATYFSRWLRKHTGSTPRDMRQIVE